MTAFTTAARRHQQAAFFHLLYVGNDGPRCADVCATVRALPGCERVARAANLADGSEGAEAIVEREGLRVGATRGCLVVVVDLEAAGGLELRGVLTRLRAVNLSPQIICFVLAPAERLSFRSFLECVAQDVAGVGELSECLECLHRWYGQTEGPCVPPDLRLPISKLPLQWLRGINHEYLRLKIQEVTREELEAAGVWQEQRLLNVWLTAIRQVLEVPWAFCPLRRVPGDADDPPTDVENARARTPSLMLLPAALEAPLSSAGLTPAADLRLYRGAAEATRLLESARQQGQPCILVRDPADDVSEAPAGVPTVFVSADELRLPWRGWQEAFARNVLGSFLVPEFLTVLPVNRQAWGTFCLRPLAEAVDQVGALLLRTYAGLEARPERPGKQERLGAIFCHIAQAWCACGLYFAGPFRSFGTSNRLAGDSPSLGGESRCV